MLRLIFQTLKNRKLFSLLFILAAVIILLALPISLTSVKQNQAQVQENITKYSRGSYDILVRPSGARNNAEKTLDIVQENYLSSGKGGISIKEWKDIQVEEDIEIAAPVAAVGYLTGTSRSYSIPMPEQSIRSSATFFTSDGVNEYQIGDPHIATMLHEGPESDSEDGFYRLMNENTNFGSPGPPMYDLPNTYHFLVGIDPESESLMTGISFDQLPDGSLPPEQGKVYTDYFLDVPIVKIMKLKDAEVPFFIEQKTDYLDINPKTTKDLLKKFELDQYEGTFDAHINGEQAYNRMLQHILDYPKTDSAEWNLDFTKKLTPFENPIFVVNKQGEIVEDPEAGHYYNTENMTMYYTTSDIDYEINEDDETLSVSTVENTRELVDPNWTPEIGTYEDIPAYRKMTEHGKQSPLYDEAPYFIATVGSYEIAEQENQLAASPLGIYSLTPTIHKESGKEIHSTIYPGSFIAPPAHGVTTIESAKLIKGSKPIDAIRVRVAGIDEYTNEAARKIKHVAKLIMDKGFEVDVVAGASHQEMEVEVEDLGTVLEPWTTLGAAAAIVKGWNGTSIILAAAFAIVSFLYVISRLSFSNVERQNETLLLSQLGWQKNHIKRKIRVEFTLMGLVGLVVSMLLFLGIQTRLDLPTYVYQIQGALFLVMVLFIFLGMKTKVTSDDLTKHRKTSIQRKHGRLVRDNLRHYQKYIRLPFIQLLIVSALSTFVYLAVKSTISDTDLTVLGQFINMQSGTVQLFIILGAYLLGLFTMIEGLITLFNIRRSEIITFLTIGWAQRHIFKLLLTEIALWTGIAAVLGGILSMVAFGFLYGFQLSIVWVVLLSLVGFYAAALLTSAIVIWVILRKNATLS